MRFAILITWAVGICCPIIATAEDRFDSAISVGDCRKLVAVTPYDNRAADYQPGIDVRGRPVAPADLTPPLNLGQDGIDLRLDIPLRVLRPDLQRVFRGIDIELGQLRYDPDSGTLQLNGQFLESPAERHIALLCRDLLPD